jgi:cytosine/adenosine deaminase-related metal-dependent hydrolase
MTCDLIVRGGLILTLDPRRTIYRSGAVAISGSRIVAVGRDADVLGSFRSNRVLDAGGAIVHPGFVETHLHMSQHSSRGFYALLAANRGVAVNFADWKAALRDEDEYASAALACLDLIRNGYTTFIDPGTAFNPDAVAAAAEGIGMRGWLADPYLWDQRQILDQMPRLVSPSLAARAPFDLDHALRILGDQLPRNRQDGLVRGYVALYGLGTASDELQRAAKECAARNGVAFMQHLGFVLNVSVVEEARLGRACVTHLAELGVLDERSALVHMNVVRDEEVQPLVETKTSVVWCPANYLLNAAPDGVPSRMAELHRLGVNVALGLDSTGYCAIGENACFALHVAASSGHSIPAESLLEMLSINPARAIGFGEHIGSLQPGRKADLVIRRRDAPDAQPSLHPAFQLAALSRTSSVDTVIVDGQIVLRHGWPTKVDEAVVFREASASVERMMGRLGLRRGGDWPVVA